MVFNANSIISSKALSKAVGRILYKTTAEREVIIMSTKSRG